MRINALLLSAIAIFHSACGATNQDVKKAEPIDAIAEPAVAENSTEPANTADASVAQPDGEDEVLVCRKAKRAGSRFATRICITQEEWDMIAESSRRETEAMQRNRNPGN